MFERTKDIAGLVRDIGVIVGVPVIITVGIFLYDLQSKALEQQAKALEQQAKALEQQVKSNEAQIKTLEAQNNLLKETQYDRALTIIKSQKEVYEVDKARLENEIAVLRTSTRNEAERVKTLEAQLQATTQKIQVTDDFSKLLNQSLQSAWQEKVHLPYSIAPMPPVTLVQPPR
jgi:predicted  nucleic acid-binding Zn-ribbon protein